MSLSYRDISIWGKLELAATPFPPSTFRARSFTLAVSKKIDASWLVSGAIHLFIDICIHQFHKTHTHTCSQSRALTVNIYIYICVYTQCIYIYISVCVHNVELLYYIYIFPHISCRCIGSYLSYLISESWRTLWGYWAQYTEWEIWPHLIRFKHLGAARVRSDR